MATRIPAYTYSGACDERLENGYWYLYLKSGGTLTFDYDKRIEVCVVGGGAAGSRNNTPSREKGEPGGGGGEVICFSVAAQRKTEYDIVIGAGGTHTDGYAGRPSSAFGTEAEGGAKGTGGQPDGGKGPDGQHAFGDSSLARYGAGGGAGAGLAIFVGGAGGADGGGTGAGGYIPEAHAQGAAATAGAPNSGGGGGGQGGGYNKDENTAWPGAMGADGGSGIVIIRGSEDDTLPVCFDDVRLTDLYFNGMRVEGLIFNGVRLFGRRLTAWWKRRIWIRKAWLRRAWLRKRKRCMWAGLNWARACSMCAASRAEA